MDASKDCLTYAHPSLVVIKYFISGQPSQVYMSNFGSLSAFDSWRYEKVNQNKVVVSLHIKYRYDENFLSEDGRILK